MSRVPFHLDPVLLYSYLYSMKATIDLPDQLYRKVKAKTASEGVTVREIAISLFRQWLDKGKSPGSSAPVVDWKNHEPPLAPQLAETPEDHSMEGVRKSIGSKWNESE